MNRVEGMGQLGQFYPIKPDSRQIWLTGQWGHVTISVKKVSLNLSVKRRFWPAVSY